MAIAPTGNLILESAPAYDWLPVFKPIIYRFSNDNGSIFIEDPTLTVVVEVSDNGIDFDNPIIAGVINSPSYTVNPAPYLVSLFEQLSPWESMNNKLFKLYRLKVWRTAVFDITGTPEITTTPARAIFASDYTVITDVETDLTIPTGEWLFQGFTGIRSYININLHYIDSDTVEAPLTAPYICPKYPIQLYWLNRFGGWQTWVFDGKHEYEDEVNEGVTWEDNEGFTHTASVGPVLQKVSVYSGFINKAYFDVIHSIRFAKVAYHFDKGVWRKIIIQPASVNKYKDGDKRREVNFSFTYSEPLINQY
jgi:hypothetical protein